MIRRAPHNINRCSITSLRACMVSCFRQSGSAPSLENPFHWLKLLNFHSMSSINFPISALWILRIWQKALNSFEKRLVKLHEKLGPGCDIHIRHKTHWHLSCAHKNHTTNLKQNQTHSDWTKLKQKMYEGISKLFQKYLYHISYQLYTIYYIICIMFHVHC